MRPEKTIAEQALLAIKSTPLYDGPADGVGDADGEAEVGTWDVIRRYPLHAEEQAAADPDDRGDVACFADGSRLTRLEQDDNVYWRAGH